MKNHIAILIILILSFSCGKKDKPKETILIKNGSSKIAKNIKDTIIDKRKLIKFQPKISFNDFLVKNIDNCNNAKLDFNSNKYASQFITRLRDAYKSDSSNFAGHYSFVFWGCGSSCQSSLIIDRLTGKIYDSPVASLGYEFYSKSRMLIVNPPDSNGFYENCDYCEPMIYVLNEKTKIFEKYKEKN